MNYYEHHLGDYAEATAHLSFVEDAAYSRLLRKIYATERPLPEEKKSVHRLLGARTKEERQAIDDVLDEFFDLRDDGWHNERADRELARFLDKQRKAKASADARWSHSERNANASILHANGHAPDGANAMRTHSERNATRARAPAPPRARSSPQSPDTSHQTQEGKDSPVAPSASPAPPPEFDGNNAKAIPERALVLLGRAFDLPEDWGLDAEALGWSRQGVLTESEKFRQYWSAGKGAGKRKTRRGWRQAWSNWLAKAAERNR